MPDTSVPRHTAVVNQNVFLEPLMGASQPQSYLDRFPEEVYNKEVDSHLVKFMYALLGPSGIGWLQRNYLEARLLFEEFGVELFDLEKFYGDPFRFGRILEETYEENPYGLLPQEKWDELRAKDASYRSRAIDFLNGVRLGNTPAGMRFVARSGLGHEVEIVENYKAVFDTYTDDPLYIAYFGKTVSTEEMIVLPRLEAPRSEIQTITIHGSPTGGTWKIKYDGRETVNIPFDAPARSENYRTLFNTDGDVAIRISSDDIDVTVEVENNAGDSDLNDLVVYVSAVEEERFDHNDADIAELVQDINANSTWVQATLVTDDVPLEIDGPFNLTGFTLGVQEALEALSNIGTGNVRVFGGPGPAEPYEVHFIGTLSNRNVLPLSATSALTGGSSPSITIAETLSGVATTDEITHIGDRARHNLREAIDRVRPQTTLPTFGDAQGIRYAQHWESVASTSRYSTVLRYVTGDADVEWPARDSINWIEGGVEHEAPRLHGDLQHHYQNFHTASAIKAYNGEAVELIQYGDGTWDNDNYFSEHIGPFTPLQRILFPEFRALTSVDNTYPATNALAEYPNVPFVSGGIEHGGKVVSIYQNSYPDNYVALNGVRPLSQGSGYFWSSDEREEGDEYLEVDLGTVQAINYITFEITRKPVSVELHVDQLDQTPKRKWNEVKYLDGIRFFSFAPEYSSSWAGTHIHFSDSQNNLVFTRHVRLKFSRRITDESPFKNTDGTLEPWSIDVRNLRIGRNLAT